MFSKIKLCSGCGHSVDNHSVYKEKCLTTGGCACREYEGDTYGTGKQSALDAAFDQFGVKGVPA